MSQTSRRIVMQRVTRLADVALVSGACLAAFAISSRAFTWPTFESVLVVRVKIINILVFGAYLAACSAIFTSCGFYVSHRLSHWARQMREILLATTALTVGFYVLPLDIAFVTSEFLVWFWLLTFGGLVITRIGGRLLLHYARSRGRNLRNIVVIGDGKEANALAERIEKVTPLGYRVVRVIKAEER